MADIGAVQSRLLTMRRGVRPPSKSRNGSICARMPLDPAGDDLRRVEHALARLGRGSPISPVDAADQGERPVARPLAAGARSAPGRGCRWCRLGAVGSKPT